MKKSVKRFGYRQTGVQTTYRFFCHTQKVAYFKCRIAISLYLYQGRSISTS